MGKEDENRRKGEMVLIVEGHKAQEDDLPADALRTLALLQAELPLKSGGAGRRNSRREENALYKYALEQQESDYRRRSRNSAATPVPGELTTTHFINHACEMVMQP